MSRRSRQDASVPPISVFRYLNLGDGVHDADGAEGGQVVTAGMVVYLKHVSRKMKVQQEEIDTNIKILKENT